MSRALFLTPASRSLIVVRLYARCLLVHTIAPDCCIIVDGRIMCCTQLLLLDKVHENTWPQLRMNSKLEQQHTQCSFKVLYSCCPCLQRLIERSFKAHSTCLYLADVISFKIFSRCFYLLDNQAFGVMARLLVPSNLSYNCGCKYPALVIGLILQSELEDKDMT